MPQTRSGPSADSEQRHRAGKQQANAGITAVDAAEAIWRHVRSYFEHTASGGGDTSFTSASDLYDLYEIDKEILTYRTPEECVEKIRYYLDHSYEAEAIAKTGRERATREHTWEKRFEKIFLTIGLIR